MLLDTTAVLLAVGLAAAGFVVVIVVSATVLRLIGFVVGDYDQAPADASDNTPDEAEGLAPADAAQDQEPGPAQASEAG
ncbi:MAG: hypothetical protein JOZ75_11540 [Candidatus Dormibacteraeota bacterium]|nr:hypothetical protein [Candidatus Dormibacteraeota bacterium]